MKILIKSGSNVNEKNHFGDTPLHLLALRRFPGKLKKKKINDFQLKYIIISK